jgi:phage baseplate assembly protein W
MSYGTDWNNIGDGDFAKLDGLALLKRSLIRRLTTEVGDVFYAPDYGFDLRSYVQADWDEVIENELLTTAVTALERDTRISEAQVSILERGLDFLQLHVFVVARDESELAFDVTATPTEVL